jgi:hypothetical protein
VRLLNFKIRGPSYRDEVETIPRRNLAAVIGDTGAGRRPSSKPSAWRSTARRRGPGASKDLISASEQSLSVIFTFTMRVRPGLRLHGPPWNRAAQLFICEDDPSGKVTTAQPL